MTTRDNQPSPVEDHAWPSQLPAHVTTDGERPRVQGFDLVGDLARHYDFGEFLVTALTGIPPNASWGRAVNMALVVLAGASVRQASVHAATIARRCGADDASVLATGLLGLVEEASWQLAQPQAAGTHDSAGFWEMLPEEVRSSVPRERTVEATALAVLTRSGLDAGIQSMMALCLARLPALVAEVCSVRSGDICGYPMRLPNFEYEQAEPDER